MDSMMRRPSLAHRKNTPYKYKNKSKENGTRHTANKGATVGMTARGGGEGGGEGWRVGRGRKREGGEGHGAEDPILHYTNLFVFYKTPF